MKRLGCFAVISLLLLAVAPATGHAQVGFFLGGGATFPMGDYGDYANTGWMASGGIWTPVGEGALGVLGEGFYGSNSHETGEFEGLDEKTNLYGGFVGATYRLGDPTRPGVFLIGKVGYVAHAYKVDGGGSEADYDETDWGFGYGGGAGFTFPRGNVLPWITVQYIGATGDAEATFVPVAVGFTYVPGGR